MRTRTPLTEAQRAAAVAGYALGEKLSALAAAAGCSPGYILRLTARAGVSRRLSEATRERMRAGHAAATDTKRERVLTLWAEGLRAREIARRTGLPRQRVANVVAAARARGDERAKRRYCKENKS